MADSSDPLTLWDFGDTATVGAVESMMLARRHAAQVAAAEATYNETQAWRAVRDARLEAPGNLRPAEMGAIRPSRRRIKQQMAERARETRGEPA